MRVARALGPADDGAEIALAAGEVIELRLPENPTTGFRWALDGALTPGLSVLEERFEPPASGRAGAGGVHVWRIAARAGGALALACRRGWGAGPPAARFAVTLRVSR